MKIISKIKWILGLLLVFFIILGTNLIDKQNFRKVRDSVVNIYEDRLLTKGYLLELTQLIHVKEIANLTVDTSFYNNRNKLVNQEIDKLVEKYIASNLLTDEARIAKRLQNDLSELVQMETADPINFDNCQKQISRINTSLGKLSKIQLEEGENQMLISKKALKNVEWYSQVEMYFLIILAVMIQILILYTPNKKPKT